MDVTNLPTAENHVSNHPVQETTSLVSEGVSSQFDGISVRSTEVTFRPGERTKFHTHPGVQVLYVTAGEGIVATRDEQQVVSEGDLVVFHAGEEHWHGNKGDADEPFSHVYFIAEAEDDELTVLDPVE